MSKEYFRAEVIKSAACALTIEEEKASNMARKLVKEPFIKAIFSICEKVNSAYTTPIIISIKN